MERKRWLTHAGAWLLLALGGGGLYVAMEQDLQRGLALLGGSVLMHVGLMIAHEDLKRARDHGQD